MSRRGKEAARQITKGQLRELRTDLFGPADNWHPNARKLWDATLSSGQTDYYQNSDLMVLYMLCDEWSEYLKGVYVTKDGEVRRKVNPIMLQTLNSILASLMLTEGDRRRARLELESGAEHDDMVDSLTGARKLYASMMQDMEIEGAG